MRKAPLLSVAALTALMGVAAPGARASETVYKWVDDKGVVHFGQQPPAQTRTEAITVQEGYSTTQAGTAAPPTEEERKAAADAETCRVASENYKMLSGGGPVKRTDEYGNEHLLTDAEKSAEKDRAQAAMGKFCKPATGTGATTPAPAP